MAAEGLSARLQRPLPRVCSYFLSGHCHGLALGPLSQQPSPLSSTFCRSDPHKRELDRLTLH